MSRKNPSAAELLILAPWWVSAFLAVAAFVGFRWIIPHFAASASNPFFKAFGGALPGMAPFAFAFLAALAVLSAVFARRRRALVDKQTSLESLKAIHWQEFEWLVGEAFRRQGYLVEEGLSRGPDGGVDVVLRKDGETTLVQCKHRKNSAVGVPVVRELFGVMTAERAHAAILITTGTFTQETHAFAAGKPIRLIDGGELLTLVQGVQRTGKSVQRDAAAEVISQTISQPAPLVAAGPLTPTCPKCGAPMIRRTAMRGTHVGNQFWGCSTYPKCNAVVN